MFAVPMLAVLAIPFVSATAPSSLITTTELELRDAQRKDRKVKVSLSYPSNPREGTMPLLVWAHCLMGAQGWYDYLIQELVPAGYAFASVGTYANVPAESNWLAKDQAFVLDALRLRAANDPTFPLYGRIVGGPAAAGGHSLGGAATYYASDPAWLGDYSGNFTSLATMSACCGWDKASVDIGICGGTNAPHDALRAVNVPSLQLTGTKDCICPPKRVAEPFYDEIGSDCKYLVEITGATHCHFDEIPTKLGPVADKVCVDLEDTLCILNPNKTERIPLERQEQLSAEYMRMWLDWSLGGRKAEDLAKFDAAVRRDAATGVILLKANTTGCAAASTPAPP